jgi:solute:Na+ symporter, SSS family
VWQILIIVAYFMVLIAIGWWSKGKVRSREGFFVANRNGSTLLIAGSLLATVIGGSATVGVAGLGFQQGLTGIWWLLVGCIGLIILGFFFAGKVRRVALYSLPELVGRQYGGKVALASAVLIVIAWTGVVAGQIVAAGKVLSILEMGTTVSWMIIFSIVLIVYAVLGGQLSVVLTDGFQAVLFFIGISLTTVLVLSQVGWISGLRVSLPEEYFSFPLSSQFGWKELLSLLIVVGTTYIVGPDMYTRLFCSRDERSARKATLLSASLLLPLAFAVVIIGMGSRILYPWVSAEQAFPQVVKEITSPLLGGLIIAALLAALMSSADTCLLSQSIILTEDIFKRFRPSFDDGKTVWLARINLIALGLIALGLALILKGVITSLLFAYTIFSCGLAVPVVGGFFRKRLKLTSQGALAALVGGGIVGMLGKIPGLEVPLKEELGLIGVVISAVLLFSVSFFSRGARRLLLWGRENNR